MQIRRLQTILFVNDQSLSCDFYERLLKRAPDLDVPGMTEFILSETNKIGLMPNKGIARLLGDNVPHPHTATGIPRCELYFLVENVQDACAHALSVGATCLSSALDRDWGDTVGYFLDPDGHILAFASPISPKT